MIIELMGTDGKLRMINTDHVVEIFPQKNVQDNEVWTVFQTIQGPFITSQPYSEIRQMLMNVMDENEFITWPYESFGFTIKTTEG